jgi:hypothetical protein
MLTRREQQWRAEEGLAGRRGAGGSDVNQLTVTEISGKGAGVGNLHVLVGGGQSTGNDFRQQQSS